MAYVSIGKADQLADGTMKEVTVNGHEVLIARVGGTFYAAAGICPHMGGRLAQGKLEGTIVTCPRHGSQFDLANGNVVRWLRGSGLFSRVGTALKSPRPLMTYNVKVERGEILVEV
jgi:3-phenylpropionate/trans-cinnamate dioxygenase ferredoxin subunit